MQTWINEAGWDRAVRLVVGLGLMALWALGVIAGGWGMAAGLVGAVLAVTGLVGVCPLYLIARFRTNRK